MSDIETEIVEEELEVSSEEATEETFELEVQASDEETSDELSAFESADIEEKEFLEHDQIISIVESLLFSTDKALSVSVITQAFKGTNAKKADVRKAIESLMVEYAGGMRGVTLEEVSGGYQLRTKVDNMKFLRRMVKGRVFKLSGPALETLSIVAYKQPCTKAEVDEIRGVESGHLLRGLMDRGILSFAGKSDLPGKPMLYQSTKKFLEIFGLRNLKELPSLSEIDELIPEGIGEEMEEKQELKDLTPELSSESSDSTYSQGEEELLKISGELEQISTSSEFFEKEKERMKQKREAERAQDIREAITVGEDVSTRDRNWLERYDLALAEATIIEDGEVESSDDDAVSSEEVVEAGAAEVEEELELSEGAMEESLEEGVNLAAEEQEEPIDLALADDDAEEDVIDEPATELAIEGESDESKELV